ncbi:MAG: NUDIX hydrolase [Lachnospiraceae bacterium]|nr:NUDIX hydrolase [Lachnospiraceae bacterium]
MEEWKCLSSHELLKNQWLTVHKDKALLPNGLIVEDYYVVELVGAVIVAAIDQCGNLVLKKEYRYPVGCTLIELPAGGIEDGENPQTAAERELLEETGYASEDWTYLGVSIDSPSKCNSKLHMFLAKNAVKVSVQQLDKTEDIDVLVVPLARAVEMCMNNEIKVGSSVHTIMTVYLQEEQGNRKDNLEE